MSKPFKMRGHTLPGPNQKSPLKANPMSGITSEMSYDEGWEHMSKDMSGSEKKWAKMNYDSGMGMAKKHQEMKQSAANSMGLSGERESQFVGDAGSSGLDDDGLVAPKDYGPDDNSTAKKSVDVEVTVNGQKV